MKIVVVINFSRSGGTLLTRILGMLPGVVVCSEINPRFGCNPENQAVAPEVALKEQMLKWHGISLHSEGFLETLRELGEECDRYGKQVIVRDWTVLDFRKNKLNGWKPSYQFSIIEQLGKVADLVVFAFTRDAIDVYLSSGGALDDFATDYLIYVKQLTKLSLPIIKYEDFVMHPAETVKKICGISGLRYSEDYKMYYTNFKCTGDTQLGKVSRGIRQKEIKLLPRKWIPIKMRERINHCVDLVEANRLLEYPTAYEYFTVENVFQMILRRLRNRYERFGR